jgi:hypothetical protein
LCGRSGGGVANRTFAGRARGNGSNEKPIFFFARFGFRRGFFLFAVLHPIGDGAAQDFHRRAAAELVHAMFGAARRDAKVGGDLCSTVRLNGHGFWLLQKFLGALPQVWIHQVAAVYPSRKAGRGADFNVIIAAGQHIDMVAIEKHTCLFADLRNPAPERNAAFADVRLADGFVLGAKNPCENGHHAQ